MQGPIASVFKARSNRHDKDIIEAVHLAVAMAGEGKAKRQYATEDIDL